MITFLSGIGHAATQRAMSVSSFAMTAQQSLDDGGTDRSTLAPIALACEQKKDLASSHDLDARVDKQSILYKCDAGRVSNMRPISSGFRTNQFARGGWCAPSQMLSPKEEVMAIRQLSSSLRAACGGSPACALVANRALLRAWASGARVHHDARIGVGAMGQMEVSVGATGAAASTLFSFSAGEPGAGAEPLAAAPYSPAATALEAEDAIVCRLMGPAVASVIRQLRRGETGAQ